MSMSRRKGRSPNASAKVWKLKSIVGGWAKDTPRVLMPGGFSGDVRKSSSNSPFMEKDVTATQVAKAGSSFAGLT